MNVRQHALDLRLGAQEKDETVPLYDIVFPDGDRSSADVHSRIEPGAAIARGRELFRVRGVASERGPSESIRVDLQPWPAQKAILGRIYDVTDR